MEQEGIAVPGGQVPPVKALDARDPGHPDHVLASRIRTAVQQANPTSGQHWDPVNDRLTASLMLLAKQAGFDARDRLTATFSDATPTHGAGAYLQLRRSGDRASEDPAANRVHVRTTDAMSVDVDETYRRADQINQHQLELARQRLQTGAEDERDRHEQRLSSSR